MATMFKLVPADPESGTSSRIDQHVEEFREFFRSRGVSFGSPGDLQPFVARLGVDSTFRDEMASLVRTVIYRERDGVSRLELVDLVAGAVAGAQVEQADDPEIREAVRQVMAFVESVFRYRWNPGAAAETAEAAAAVEPGEPAVHENSDEQPPEPVPVLAREAASQQPASASAGSEPGVVSGEAVQNTVQPHAMTDMFYRAQVVSGVEPAEAIAQERKQHNATAEPRGELDREHADEGGRLVHAGRDRLGAAEYEALPLRLLETDGPGPPKKTSRLLIWTAVVCALLLAFCAGLVVHQRLLVPLRDPHQPYEAPPADTSPEVTSQPATAGPVATPSQGAVTAAPRRGQEARSRDGRRHGRGEYGHEDPGPLPRAAATDNSGTSSGLAAAKNPVEPAARASGSVVDTPAERPGAGMGGTANLQPRYMAPAMIGASPALMASHLVYAPEPDYPLMAQISHIRGKVLVEAVVGKSGRVIRAEAISGHRLLRGAAVREVYERRYRPYLLNDRPTDVATIVAVDFGHEKP